MSLTEKILIGPIGYETSLTEVRLAFELGCSSVIVDGAVPQDVCAEIVGFRIPVPDEDTVNLHDTLEGLKWDRPERLPDLTREWMEAQLCRLQDAGLRPPLRKEKEVFHQSMVAWFRQAKDFPWHVDDQDMAEFPDVHLHVYGEGLVVAKPEKGPTEVSLLHGQPVTGTLFGREDYIEVADQSLRQKGFNIVSLQPGQMLVFKDACLHRSSCGDRAAMKLRAGMF